MFSITITDKNGAQRQLDFDVPELTIGRVDENELVLPKSNVSKQHARLVHKEGRYVLSDLKSTNGTYVNGRRISSPVVVREGDKIYIGDFILGLGTPSGGERAHPPLDVRSPVLPPPRQQTVPMRRGSLAAGLPGASIPAGPGERGAAARSFPNPASARHPGPAPAPPVVFGNGLSEPPPVTLIEDPDADGGSGEQDGRDPANQDGRRDPANQDGRRDPANQDGRRDPASDRTSPGTRPPRVESPDSSAGALTSPAVLTPSVRLQGALATLMERLSEGIDVYHPEERAFPSEAASMLDGLLESLDDEGVLGADLDRRFLREAAISEAVGLGPLDRLLRNRSVREVVVDGPSRILADLGGGLSPVSSFFSASASVLVVAQRLMARAGAVLTGAPVQRVVLQDGAQVLVLMPPLSLQGPLLSVRRPIAASVSPEGLVTEGIFSSEMLELLRASVHGRQNVLITGPASSGVTTLWAALGALAHDHERLVALHGGPGIAIAHPQVLSLCRPGAPDASLIDLLEHAAQLRYDRLMVDDLRAQDALPMLTAAGGTRGFIMAMHAPSATAALEQLELFTRLSMPGSPSSVAALLAHAIQLVVHLRVEPDGARRVETIASVRVGRGDGLELRPLFRYDGSFRRVQ